MPPLYFFVRIDSDFFNAEPVRMLALPFYVYAVSILTVLTVAVGVFHASGYRRPFMIILSVWIIVQCLLGAGGFYLDAYAIPPRFPLLIIPPMVMLLVNLSTRRGRQFLDGFNIRTLTLLQTVRVPVELTLYWLFEAGAVPELLTFEGRNLDIISGISAPFVYYFGFVRPALGRGWMIAWNILCLLLLFNVVFYAVLSAPGPLQRFAFDQPNIAVAHFPFILLPSFLVPMVMLSHAVSIRQLLKRSS